LFVLSALYIATAVLTILSITLNDQRFQESGEELTPGLPFRLEGIAGGEETALFFLVFIALINFLVMVITFALLYLGSSSFSLPPFFLKSIKKK